jgi:D-xylose transport system permease protein
VLVALAAEWLFVTGYSLARPRRGRPLQSTTLLGPGFAAWYLNQDRGIGRMFVGFVVLVLLLNYAFTRTRSPAALGGLLSTANQASGAAT